MFLFFFVTGVGALLLHVVFLAGCIVCVGNCWGERRKGSNDMGICKMHWEMHWFGFSACWPKRKRMAIVCVQINILLFGDVVNLNEILVNVLKRID